MSDFTTFAANLKQLDVALAQLQPVAERLGVSAPVGAEWFELLRHKLLPQVESRPLLVVGIVGGTNIGKSVVFNHLAGEVASASSPLAAGTRHPVCLVPSGLEDADELARLFEAFELHRWHAAEDSLADSPEDRLFWRTGENMPPQLLLLDAPDVDSDAEVNWQRARTIRQSADVLVAVLTQQKYNDAAVKQFFRAAVEADKPIVVVFNQCDLEADADYWPQWLATFCEATGATPELVYVVPYDRKAAESLRLPFYRVKADGATQPGEPTSLRDELASLHFDTIKIRTLRGALTRVLDEQQGVGAYLRSIREVAAQFEAAADTLSSSEMARVAWPTLPASILVDEIRDWWDAERSEWSRQVHGFYRTLGRGVIWPAKKAWEAMAGPHADPLATFHQRERQAVVLAVEKLIDELDRLSRIGNDTLRPRLERLLRGDARAELLRRVEAAHERLPAVDQDYRQFLRNELNTWRESNPRAVRVLRSLDQAAAVARPAITVTLAVSGWVLAGDLVSQAAVHAAGDTLGQVATEAAIAGGITGGGEAIVSGTSEGVRQTAGRLFLRLQAGYARRRAQWLAGWLEGELLGSLLGELRSGAGVPHGETFRDVQTAVDVLREDGAGG